MANGVYHQGLGIELNLTEPDLGHPEHPGLWDALRADRRSVDERQLQCIQCRYIHPDCPEWMYLNERHGIRFATHWNPNIGEHPSTNEGDKHKALKDRIAKAAELDGHTVEVEDRAEDGKRRTDVLVKGAGGLLIGHEVQLSYATTDSVRKRTLIARHDGISPLWSTVDRLAQWIGHVPWVHTDNLPWQQISTGRELLVRGGVRALAWTLCDRNNPEPCPVKGHGRCGQRHGKWDLAHPELDTLVRDTASGEFVPVIVPQGRRMNRIWVKVADRDLYAESVGGLPSEDDFQPRKARVVDTGMDPREVDPECKYGQDSGIRSAPAVSQDTLGAIVTASTLPAVTLTPPPMPQRRPGECGASGNGPGGRCGVTARLYPGGWRCEDHRPGSR
jgi:hypothetical protein